MRETLLSAVSVVIAVVLLGLLYAYVFVWHNTPNLARLLGLNA
jgi:ABC-type sulfate transport system permease component